MTDFVVKNRTVELIISLKRRDGSKFDMSGKTAQIGYRISNNPSTLRNMTVISPPTNGQVKYIFDKLGAAWDLSAPGVLYADVHVYDAVGKLISSSKLLEFVVRDVIVQP